MNFSTEKMAKALDFPNKAYLNELKKYKPSLYAQCLGEYDQGFKVFFNGMVQKIKKIITSQIDFVKFVDDCTKEFKAKKEMEEQLLAKRMEPQPPASVTTVVNEEYVLSDYNDDDFDEYPSFQRPSIKPDFEKRYDQLKRDYKALSKDYEVMATRYANCRKQLQLQVNLNNELQQEIDTLKENCICSKIEDIVLNKRPRV